MVLVVRVRRRRRSPGVAAGDRRRPVGAPADTQPSAFRGAHFCTQGVSRRVQLSSDFFVGDVAGQTFRRGARSRRSSSRRLRTDGTCVQYLCPHQQPGARQTEVGPRCSRVGQRKCATPASRRAWRAPRPVEA